MTAVLVGIDIPNPIDVVTNIISAPLGWAWDKVTQGIANWVLGAVAYFVDGVINFLLTAARPDVTSTWFSGAGSPYAAVRSIAVVLLLAFVFLGIVQGVLAGDAGGMLRRIATDVPAAVFGIVTTTVVVGKLLDLTDALSAQVLSNSGGQGVQFLAGFGVAVNGATQGFAAVLVGLIAVIAGFFVWVELLVRSILVYILVALSPLSFAAMVWPSARGVLRRTVELLLAVIVSKFVICIAIAVGVAALSGAGTAGAAGGAADHAATSMGTLLVGTAVLAMAAFAPFLVLKLIPWAESALIAQGVSRGPVRGAQSTMSNVYHAQSLTRLAGGSVRGPGAIGAGGGGWSVGAPAVGTMGASGALGAVGGPALLAKTGAAAAARVPITTAKSAEAATGSAPAPPSSLTRSDGTAVQPPRRPAHTDTPTGDR